MEGDVSYEFIRNKQMPVEVTYTLVGEWLCAGLLAVKLALASERVDVRRRHIRWCDVVRLIKLILIASCGLSLRTW